jgi:hypothetical protein
LIDSGVKMVKETGVGVGEGSDGGKEGDGIVEDV